MTLQKQTWPKKLKIRDTTFYDDMGGGGQRICTTAGRGYETQEYINADLIDMDVLRRVEAGYSKALTEAESWIHDQLDGTGHVEDALADLDESRSALTGLRAMMEKLK